MPNTELFSVSIWVNHILPRVRPSDFLFTSLDEWLKAEAEPAAESPARTLQKENNHGTSFRYPATTP